MRASSEGVIETGQLANLTVKGSQSMKNPGLMFGAKETGNNLQSQISRNFQNQINDKGFLDFEDLL